MARREKEMNKKEKEGGAGEPWGTLEELLLACAVNRHGVKSWDSISIELQKRTSDHHLRAVYSPPNCKRKYIDLRRRFTGGDGEDEEMLKTMVDELKKLRVAELRREVERHDVSIEFLQLKLKRLEEERGQTFKPKEEEEREETDLPSGPNKQEPDKSLPEAAAGNSLSGYISDCRENRSLAESNSTSNEKDENRAADGDKRELKQEPEIREPKPEQSEPEQIQTGPKPESSCSLALKLTEERAEPDPAECDSVAESKRDVKEEPKQSGEEQSSKKKKRRRRNRFPIVSSSGEDEQDGDDVPLVAKQIAIKSQPLIKILSILRSHKNASVLFERRLRSQETEKYKKTIRRHMDLQTVQCRVDKGLYTHCQRKFFRDLLLIFTNALVFFSKSSVEFSAASDLRKIIITEMAKTIPKPDPSRKQSDPTPARPEKVATPPIVVCRRRSSTSSKRAPTSEVSAKIVKGADVKSQAKIPNSNSNHQLVRSNNSKAKEKLVVKKQEVIKASTKVNKRRRSPAKKVEESSCDDSDDDDNDDDKIQRSRKSKGGEREQRRDKREQQSSNLGKRVRRSGKGSPPAATVGRGKRGKENGGGGSTAAEESGRMRKRSRR